MRRAMIDTVDEVGRVTATEGIDCDFAKGGTVVWARSAVQLRAARADVDEAESYGVDELELWDADRVTGVADALGASFDPACARLHPAKLVRGVAAAVERRGAVVHESTEVLDWEAGRVITDRGVVLAGRIVLATEAWTASLQRVHRRLMPLYSLMVATEPMPETFWASTGIQHGQTFSDYRHLLIYGQRTADDRIAFGGRGARYHWGSTIQPAYDLVPTGVPAPACDPSRAVSGIRRHSYHPPLGRADRGAEGLARERSVRPRDGFGERGRLCRRRAQHDEPRRPHARRSADGARDRAHLAPVGGSHLTRLGTRASAVRGGERRPHRSRARRRGGADHSSPLGSSRGSSVRSPDTEVTVGKSKEGSTHGWIRGRRSLHRSTRFEVPIATPDELEAALASVWKAWTEWIPATTVAERAAAIGRVADLHEERKEELGDILVREMGKPRAQAVGEAEFSGAIYRFYADNAEKLMADEPIEGAASTAYLRKSPTGPLLGIMPWNFRSTRSRGSPGRTWSSATRSC